MFTTVQKTYTNPWQAVASGQALLTPWAARVTFGPLNLMREGMHKQRKPSEPVLFFFFFLKKK